MKKASQDVICLLLIRVGCYSCELDATSKIPGSDLTCYKPVLVVADRMKQQAARDRSRLSVVLYPYVLLILPASRKWKKSDLPECGKGCGSDVVATG